MSGLDADILFSLVGVTQLLTKAEVLDRLLEFGISRDNLDNAFELMLWYGVLGIGSRDGSVRFIYDYEYSLKRLQAEIRSIGEDVLYVVNSALHVALRS